LFNRPNNPASVTMRGTISSQPTGIEVRAANTGQAPDLLNDFEQAIAKGLLLDR
jgi:hypothetical protein